MSEQRDEKLLPCPFCNEQPSSQKYPGDTNWTVQCVNGHTETLDAEVWNTRKSPANSAVEPLRELDFKEALMWYREWRPKNPNESDVIMFRIFCETFGLKNNYLDKNALTDFMNKRNMGVWNQVADCYCGGSLPLSIEAEAICERFGSRNMPVMPVKDEIKRKVIEVHRSTIHSGCDLGSELILYAVHLDELSTAILELLKSKGWKE